MPVTHLVTTLVSADGITYRSSDRGRSYETHDGLAKRVKVGSRQSHLRGPIIKDYATDNDVEHVGYIRVYRADDDRHRHQLATVGIDLLNLRMSLITRPKIKAHHLDRIQYRTVGAEPGDQRKRFILSRGQSQARLAVGIGPNERGG